MHLKWKLCQCRVADAHGYDGEGESEAGDAVADEVVAGVLLGEAHAGKQSPQELCRPKPPGARTQGVPELVHVAASLTKPQRDTSFQLIRPLPRRAI